MAEGARARTDLHTAPPSRLPEAGEGEAAGDGGREKTGLSRSGCSEQNFGGGSGAVDPGNSDSGR